VIVADASALLEALLRTSVRRLFDSGQTLHAPHLVDLEVAQVVRRYAAAGELAAERGREVLADLADFPMLRYPHGFLLPRIWELRGNLTGYDAVYVALAEVLGAPLLTRDRRLAGPSSAGRTRVNCARCSNSVRSTPAMTAFRCWSAPRSRYAR